MQDWIFSEARTSKTVSQRLITQRHLPPPPGCIGLLMRGLIGAKPPTVKLVTSLGFENKGGPFYDCKVVKSMTFVQSCNRTDIPWSRLPEQGDVLYKQTCLRFQPASCSEEKRSLWRCDEFHLHGPEKKIKKSFFLNHTEETQC